MSKKKKNNSKHKSSGPKRMSGSMANSGGAGVVGVSESSGIKADGRDSDSIRMQDESVVQAVRTANPEPVELVSGDSIPADKHPELKGRRPKRIVLKKHHFADDVKSEPESAVATGEPQAVCCSDGDSHGDASSAANDIQAVLFQEPSECDSADEFGNSAVADLQEQKAPVDGCEIKNADAEEETETESESDEGILEDGSCSSETSEAEFDDIESKDSVSDDYETALDEVEAESESESEKDGSEGDESDREETEDESDGSEDDGFVDEEVDSEADGAEDEEAESEVDGEPDSEADDADDDEIGSDDDEAVSDEAEFESEGDETEDESDGEESEGDNDGSENEGAEGEPDGDGNDEVKSDDSEAEPDDDNVEDEEAESEFEGDETEDESDGEESDGEETEDESDGSEGEESEDDKPDSDYADESDSDDGEADAGESESEKDEGEDESDGDELADEESDSEADGADDEEAESDDDSVEDEEAESEFEGDEAEDESEDDESDREETEDESDGSEGEESEDDKPDSDYADEAASDEAETGSGSEDDESDGEETEDESDRSEEDETKDEPDNDGADEAESDDGEAESEGEEEVGPDSGKEELESNGIAAASVEVGDAESSTAHNSLGLDDETVERMKSRRRERKRNFHDNLTNIRNTIQKFYENKDNPFESEEPAAEQETASSGEGFMFVKADAPAPAVVQKPAASAQAATKSADAVSERGNAVAAVANDSVKIGQQSAVSNGSSGDIMAADASRQSVESVSNAKPDQVAQLSVGQPVAKQSAMKNEPRVADVLITSGSSESRKDADEPKPEAFDSADDSLVEADSEEAVELQSAESDFDDASDDTVAVGQQDQENQTSEPSVLEQPAAAVSLDPVEEPAEQIVVSYATDPVDYDEFDEFDDEGNIIWKTVDDYSHVFSEEFKVRFVDDYYLTELKREAEELHLNEKDSLLPKPVSTIYGIKGSRGGENMIDRVHKGLERPKLKVYEYVKSEYPLVVCTKKITFRQYFTDLYMNLRSHEYASESVFEKIIYGTTYPKRILKMRDVTYKYSLPWLILSALMPVFGYLSFVLTSKTMPIFARRCLTGAALGTAILIAFFGSIMFGWIGMLPSVFL